MSEAEEKAAATRHAARMLAWEDQVAEDPEGARQSTANRVVRLLRRRVEQRSGRATGDWVEQPRMARELSVTRQGLQKALYWLVKRGHLRIHCRKNWRVANEYEPLLKVAHAKATQTAVGIARQRSKPPLARDANAGLRPAPTAGGTSKHLSSSKISGGENGCWEKVKEELRAEIGGAKCDEWFGRLSFEGIDDSVVKLAAPTLYFKKQIVCQFDDALLLRAWQRVAPAVQSVVIDVETASAEEVRRAAVG